MWTSLIAVLPLILLPTISALNAPVPDTLTNEDTCMRTVGYWGQNGVGSQFPDDKLKWEQSLDQYCTGPRWDIISIAFLNVFKSGYPPLPGLNFAYHCDTAPNAEYPHLLYCPQLNGMLHNQESVWFSP